MAEPIFTIKTIQNWLESHSVNVDSKLDPLALMVEDLAVVDAAKAKEIGELLQYEDEFVELVNRTLSKPAISKQHVERVNDLADTLKALEVKYSGETGSGFRTYVTTLVKGKPEERFVYAWNGIKEVIQGLVNDVNAVKEIKAGYETYGKFKKDALAQLIIMERDYKPKVRNLLEALEASQKAMEEYKGTDELESGRLKQEYELALKAHKEADNNLRYVGETKVLLSQSNDIADGLYENLDSIVTVLEGEKRKLATLLSTHQSVYAFMHATYAAETTADRGAQVIDVADASINDAVQMISRRGREKLVKGYEAAHRASLDPANIIELRQAVAETQLYIARRGPELDKERETQYAATNAKLQTLAIETGRKMLQYAKGELAAPAPAQ